MLSIKGIEKQKASENIIGGESRGRGLGAVLRWAAGPVAGARAACGTDGGRESGCR